MKVSARKISVVGTARRAVRNDAPLMCRWRYIAARTGCAPYHLSQRSARRLQYAVSCCLCCFLVFISSVAFAEPRLIVPSEGIAFGEVAVGSNVVGKVVLRNEGSATVSVPRVKACCGAKAELSVMKIPPKGCECCQCESVASSNVASFQSAIGNWNWILATMATFLRPASRHPPRPDSSRPLPLAHAARVKPVVKNLRCHWIVP